MTYKIEKGVEVPEKWASGTLKYPWPDMGHGDSLLVPWTEADKARRAINKRGAIGSALTARRWLNRHRPGWKCVSRTEGEATRIWFLDPEVDG